MSLVGNGNAELRATGTKPVSGAAGFEETPLGSLRVGYGQMSAWSRNGWNFGVAGENTLEKNHGLCVVGLKASVVMDHNLLSNLYGSLGARTEKV